MHFGAATAAVPVGVCLLGGNASEMGVYSQARVTGEHYSQHSQPLCIHHQLNCKH